MPGKNPLDDKKILIVDDDPDVLETLEELLPMCAVTKAASFEEAKRLLETREFDMAILDIMGVDGYTLLEIAGERGVIAAMLTANALSPEDTVKSFEGGAAYYIPKEEMGNIEKYLIDIIEAKQQKKHFWSRWLDRFDPYYEKRFGKDWKDHNVEFWKNFGHYVKPSLKD